MGRPSKIENHPKRQYIIEAIIEGKDSYRNIAKRFDISASAVAKYKTTILPEKLSKAIAIKALERKETVENQCNETAREQLQNVMGLMYKMLKACDDYLSDPKDPSRYELGPRAWEIDVVYLGEPNPSTGNRKPETAPLQALLDRLEDGLKTSCLSVAFKQADPREVIIKTATVLTKQLEIVAKIDGIIQDTTVNVTVNQQWQQIEQIIYEATEGAPEIRKKIVERMQQ